jgi:hypothetical protein
MFSIYLCIILIAKPYAYAEANNSYQLAGRQIDLEPEKYNYRAKNGMVSLSCSIFSDGHLCMFLDTVPGKRCIDIGY